MRKLKVPNTYVIIAVIIALCAVLTWFVPGGQYVKAEDGTLSYEAVDAVPQTWQVLSAVYHGFVKQAGIIVFILVVGGAFWLLNATGAVEAGIQRFIVRIGKRDILVLVALTVLFSLAGAVFGMSEETIPFVGIVVPLVVSMGYDAFMGMLVVYVASNVGFSSAFLNPFTVGIAQGMADLPLFSGMSYRIFCWAFLTLLMVVFVCLYAKRTRKEPTVILEERTDCHSVRQRRICPAPDETPVLDPRRPPPNGHRPDRRRHLLGVVYARNYGPVPRDGHRMRYHCRFFRQQDCR